MSGRLKLRILRLLINAKDNPFLFPPPKNLFSCNEGKRKIEDWIRQQFEVDGTFRDKQEEERTI